MGSSHNGRLSIAHCSAQCCLEGRGLGGRGLLLTQGSLAVFLADMGIPYCSLNPEVEYVLLGLAWVDGC